MKVKHILFLPSWYPSRVEPYNGDFIQRHARAAALVNRISVVYAVKDSELKTDFEITKNEGNVREIIVYYSNAKFRPFNFFKRLKALNMGLKQLDNFDMVHLNVCYPAGVFALYLKFFKKKKYVLTEHWTGLTKEKFAAHPFIERFFIRKILKNAEFLMPVSAELGSNLTRIAPGIKIKIIPNVVDTDRFQPENIQKPNQKIRFLHLSMLLDKHKNISGMLNVAKRLAEAGYDFEFHIGGNGPTAWIDEFIKTHHLEEKVKTFGALKHEEVPRKMAESDCFVLFSNFENQPCVQIESYAAGVPFIGSDVGGISEFMPSEFGILVAKGNEDELFDAMTEVINGRKFKTKEALHEYAVNHFSPVVIAQQFDEIYQKVLENEEN